MPLFHVSAPIGPWPGCFLEADSAEQAIGAFRSKNSVPAGVPLEATPAPPNPLAEMLAAVAQKPKG